MLENMTNQLKSRKTLSSQPFLFFEYHQNGPKKKFLNEEKKSIFFSKFEISMSKLVYKPSFMSLGLPANFLAF
jgi:hypothetical protein